MCLRARHRMRACRRCLCVRLIIIVFSYIVVSICRLNGLSHWQFWFSAQIIAHCRAPRFTMHLLTSIWWGGGGRFKLVCDLLCLLLFATLFLFLSFCSLLKGQPQLIIIYWQLKFTRNYKFIYHFQEKHCGQWRVRCDVSWWLICLPKCVTDVCLISKFVELRCEFPNFNLIKTIEFNLLRMTGSNSKQQLRL